MAISVCSPEVKKRTEFDCGLYVHVNDVESLLQTERQKREEVVEVERKRIKKDLRSVYFDVITTCCSECEQGNKFNCGGCGGTRRPSNASAGDPLNEYIKKLSPLPEKQRIVD